MDWQTTTFAIILGVLLRIAVPLVVTILIFTVLKRLDEHWKREADIRPDQQVKPGNVGCWEFNSCPEKARAACKAYQNPDSPCWQVFRDKNGRMQERCIGCDVFRHAPVPVTT
jgi:hypothetical protein